MKESIAKGSEYDRLLADFLRLGGDLSKCPFDAEGYKYEGPELRDGEVHVPECNG